MVKHYLHKLPGVADSDFDGTNAANCFTVLGNQSGGALALCPPEVTGRQELFAYGVIHAGYYHPETGERTDVAVPLPPGYQTPEITLSNGAKVRPPQQWRVDFDAAAKAGYDQAKVDAQIAVQTYAEENEYRFKRADEYEKRLCRDKTRPSKIMAIGDVLDVLIKRVRQLEDTLVNNGITELPDNQEWQDLKTEIDAIKTENPKPGA